jgi:hypothetical protein
VFTEVNAMPVYKPNRGGHAPGHLRGFFWSMLDLDDGEAETWWPDRMPADQDPLAWVSAQLRNCTDTMPAGGIGDHFDDVPIGASYAVAARRVQRSLADPASLLSRERARREALCAAIRRRSMLIGVGILPD